jgi:hypothetical protein
MEGGVFEPSLEVEERMSARMAVLDGTWRSTRVLCIGKEKDLDGESREGPTGVKGMGLDGSQWGRGTDIVSALLRSEFLPIVSFLIMRSARFTFGRWRVGIGVWPLFSVREGGCYSDC